MVWSRAFVIGPTRRFTFTYGGASCRNTGRAMRKAPHQDMASARPRCDPIDPRIGWSRISPGGAPIARRKTRVNALIGASRGSCGLRLEQIQIDRHPHREVTRAVGMQLVARTAGRALGDELRLKAAGLRVVGDAVEIDHAIEQSGSADEIVERAASL